MNGDMGVPAYLLHPMVVHFPIALLVLGLCAGLASLIPGAPAWLRQSLPWVLGVGTLFLWAALGLGLLAERLAPHVPAAWHVMADHKEHAWITAWIFTGLCALRLWAGERHRAWILAAWALGVVSLVLTAHLGATLVFAFGLGTPQP